MTPEQAQDVKLELLGCMDSADVSEHLKDAAATIAELRWEYRAEVREAQNSQWHPVTKWSTEWPLRCGVIVGDRERIVRRIVGDVEETL